MAEYIERSKAENELDEWFDMYPDSDTAREALTLAKRAIKKLPAADVRPVVRAAWRGIGKTGRIFVCSACDKTFPYKTRYCPNCGAVLEES